MAFFAYFLFFQRCESPFQIGDDVIDMFRADGKTDCIRLNALIFKLFLCKLAVSCSCRVNYKALNISNIGKKRENFEIINKFMRLFNSALDFKGED